MDYVKKNPNLVLGLTSIGYDGERFDNVTGLPKPRIDVWPGNFVAIAESCKSSCSAGLEVIKKTDISTPLGKVLICLVVSAGKVVLAGANKRGELRLVLDALYDLTNLIIVDGALNRIAPMAETDCLILVTGAARCLDMPSLALESAYMVDILSTPVLAEYGKVESVVSIFSRAAFKAFVDKCHIADSIRIQGIIAEQFLKELIALSNRFVNKRLIFDDPMKLLLAGEPLLVWKDLKDISSQSIEIGVEKSCKLLAITVNPYYPKYRHNRADYEAAYINKEELLKSVGSKIKIPCYDVVQQGGQAIFQMIMDHRNNLV